MIQIQFANRALMRLEEGTVRRSLSTDMKFGLAALAGRQELKIHALVATLLDPPAFVVRPEHADARVFNRLRLRIVLRQSKGEGEAV